MESIADRLRRQTNELAETMLDAGLSTGEATQGIRFALTAACLVRTNGNQSRAAKALNVHRNTLARVCDQAVMNGRADPVKAAKPQAKLARRSRQLPPPRPRPYPKSSDPSEHKEIA